MLNKTICCAAAQHVLLYEDALVSPGLQSNASNFLLMTFSSRGKKKTRKLPEGILKATVDTNITNPEVKRVDRKPLSTHARTHTHLDKKHA